MAFQMRKQTIAGVLGGLLIFGGPLTISVDGSGGGVVQAAQFAWPAAMPTSKRPLFRPVGRSSGQSAAERGKWRPRTTRSVRPGHDAFEPSRTRPWSWQPALNAPPAHGVGISDLEAARRQGLKFRPHVDNHAKTGRKPAVVSRPSDRPIPVSHRASGFRPAEARPSYEHLYAGQRSRRNAATHCAGRRYW